MYQKMMQEKENRVLRIVTKFNQELIECKGKKPVQTTLTNIWNFIAPDKAPMESDIAFVAKIAVDIIGLEVEENNVYLAKKQTQQLYKGIVQDDNAWLASIIHSLYQFYERKNHCGVLANDTEKNLGLIDELKDKHYGTKYNRSTSYINTRVRSLLSQYTKAGVFKHNHSSKTYQLNDILTHVLIRHAYETNYTRDLKLEQIYKLIVEEQILK